MKRIAWLLFSVFFVVSADQRIASGAESKEAKEEKKEVKMLPKTMEGTVSARNFNGLALTYKTDKAEAASFELWLPYEPKMKFSGGYKSSKDVGEGDKVRVFYDEAEDQSKKLVTGVQLLKRKPKEEELVSTEEE